MSFIRPEARAALARWREVALALGAAAFGVWLAMRGGVFYATLGGLTLAFALAFALTAWRRLRFQVRGDGPGVVQIDEGAIGYFGPAGGGAIALSELDRIDALTEDGALCWRLHQSDGTTLTIPAAALGAGQLFDTFAALRGARPRAFLDAVERPPTGTRRIWRRTDTSAEARLPRP